MLQVVTRPVESDNTNSIRIIDIFCLFDHYFKGNNPAKHIAIRGLLGISKKKLSSVLTRSKIYYYDTVINNLSWEMHLFWTGGIYGVVLSFSFYFLLTFINFFLRIAPVVLIWPNNLNARSKLNVQYVHFQFLNATQPALTFSIATHSNDRATYDILWTLSHSFHWALMYTPMLHCVFWGKINL